MKGEDILRDIRKVNMKVDTYITEVTYNIHKTKKKIAERKQQAKERKLSNH
jgi:hypothetical protein